MSQDTLQIHKPAAEISQEALARAEEMIEREEGAQNRLVGGLAVLVTTTAVLMSVRVEAETSRRLGATTSAPAINAAAAMML